MTFRTSCLAFFFALAVLPTRAAPPALVIANAAYDESLGLMPLETPARDAEVMKEALESLAEPFDVEVHRNLKKARLRQVVSEFISKHAAEPLMFIYYSGHGMQVNGANYLLAVDSDLRLDAKAEKLRSVFSGASYDAALETLKRETAEQEALPLNDVLAWLPVPDPARLPLRIVVLDSCRSPFVVETSTKSVFKAKGGGLARVDEKPGLFIGYAASANQEAQQNDASRFKDGSTPPSLFTEHLAHRLKEGGPVDQVFNQAATDVYAVSSKLAKEGVFSGVQTPARYALAYRPHTFLPGAAERAKQTAFLDSLMIPESAVRKTPPAGERSKLDKLKLERDDNPGSTSIFDSLTVKRKPRAPSLGLTVVRGENDPPGVTVLACGSAATKAGVRGGDRVVKVGGHEVPDLEAFEKAVEASSADGVVSLGLIREGQALEVSIKP